MRRLAWLCVTLAVLVVSIPVRAEAAGYGFLEYNKKRTPLTSACAIAPRLDMQGWGKPEVTMLVSDQALDCAVIAGWASPDSGAFHQAVDVGDGVLVSISFQPGLQLGRVSVYGVGFTLGGDRCEGCKAVAAYAGAGLKGSVTTTKALKLSDSTIAFDVAFDLPKPAAPGGAALPPGGGAPGKALLGCVAAYKAGDYAALQKLLPEGEAVSKWGYYDEGDERKKTIQDEDRAKMTPKILEGWSGGDWALVVFETRHPFDASEKVKAVAGLGLEGSTWRLRETKYDYTGTMFDK